LALGAAQLRRPTAAVAHKINSRWLAAPATCLATVVPAEGNLEGLMPNENMVPVVLLVYTNDRLDPGHHLRNLAEELQRIRAALKPVEDAGPVQGAV
jgi:hypothetical protein